MVSESSRGKEVEVCEGGEVGGDGGGGNKDWDEAN